MERARLLIEQAEARGEPPDDPLLLFSVIYDFWAANYVGFNGDAMRRFAAEFLSLAEKQGATVPLMVGHRLMGVSLASTGDLTQAREHYDQALPPLRSCRTSPAGNAFYGRHSGSNFEFSVMGACGC